MGVRLRAAGDVCAGGRPAHGGWRACGAGDLVAFFADALTCPIDELPGTEILLTLVGGRAVHDPGALMEEERH